jgi:hypothetical protein
MGFSSKEGYAMKMNVRKTIPAALGLALSLGLMAVGSQARAQTPAFTLSGGSDFNNGQWSLGFQLAQSHDVGIFDLGGNLLTSATVNPSDPLTGLFRYTSITPYDLVAGTQYVIASTTGSENYNYNPATFATAPEISFVSDRYVSSTALAFPVDGPVNVAGWFGPNFQFQSTAA